MLKMISEKYIRKNKIEDIGQKWGNSWKKIPRKNAERDTEHS